jgi:histidinol phosphatase-like enzyme
MEQNLTLMQKMIAMLPMAYMLSHAPAEAVQIFCSLFVENCSYRKNIHRLSRELKQKNDIDINYSEFIGASELKLAYMHGIKF